LREHTGPPAYYRFDSDTDVAEVWQPMIGTLNGMADAGGLYNPLELRSYAAYWNTAKTHRNTVLYDLLSVRYTLAISPSLISDPKFTHVADGENYVKVAENIHAYPRLFVVHETVAEADDATALNKLLDGTVLGWHGIVLPDGGDHRSKTPSTLETGNPGETATITRYTPNQVEADLAVQSAGWVVLTDVWYPGWQATLDGQAVPIERADTLFRAVAVSPGHHTLVFRFAPDSLRLGAAISGVTGGLLLLGTGVGLWRRRARKT
jgi:hypothetical protein